VADCSIIAIANQKGGVGKTATAVNMAAALSQLKKRVLVIDLDAQANATRWLSGKEFDDGHVVYDVMMRTSKIEDTIIRNPEGVNLVPANLSLASLDYDLMSVFNRDYRLAKVLEPIKLQYDFIIVDCPPNLGVTTINGLAAADFVIAPIETKSEALQAVPRLANTIQLIAKESERILPLFGLPTFLERTNLSRDMLAQTQALFEVCCLPAINKTTRLAEAAAENKSIFSYDPSSAGALDYLRMTKEFINAIGEKATKAIRSKPTKRGQQ
jgi:chromosome partitioning protein